ncbi:MAG: primary-amine oxidase [Ornithinimicrobium sp.]
MSQQHPLDSLSSVEFSRTAEVIAREQGVDGGWRYASITLLEPPKREMLTYVASGSPSARPKRLALAVLWEKSSNHTYEAVVDLDEDRVESWTHIPGVCPNFTVDEYHDVDVMLKQHEATAEALAARGITDLSLVLFDVWTYGKEVMPSQWRDRRLGWVDIWLRATPRGNPYAHPVSGLKVIVDMNSLEVLQVEDHHDYGLPEVDGEYAPSVRGTQVRKDLKPLHITQPEGVSFSLDGSELRWQNWSMRLGFNYREGPVIYQVAFTDEGVQREVAYRLSFAEMIVPYRDSSFDHYRRTAFDIGEWGLGYMTTPLELGCDCLGEITYVDAVVPDSAGQPVEIPQAICLHEEDNAVLWKHVDPDTGAEVRRMRRMVVSTHATVANYEYLIYWRFYTDGNIECEVRATGIMVTTPLPPGQERAETGTLVDARTYAPFHQHFLVARLDLDVDGQDNSVIEVDSVAAPVSETNPHGMDVHTRGTVIESEAQSARDYEWRTQRAWKVQHDTKKNALGDPVAYKLVPGAAIPVMMDPAAPAYRRSPVIGHTLWVTAHDDGQRWPAGDYPTQAGEGQGITEWIRRDAPLAAADVVLWYVFGIHHITRAEDWPVMPADTIAFWLKPFGFFDRNPSLDAAPSAPHACSNGSCGENCTC